MSRESKRGTVSRRGFLRVCAVGAAGVAGATAVGSTGVGVPSVEGTVPSVLDGQDDAEATVEELEAELLQRRQERLADLSSMDGQTRERAREVGIAARQGVVVFRATANRLGTAWAVDEHHLLTVAHNVPTDVQGADCWTLGGESFEAEVVDVDEDRSPDVALLDTDRSLSPLPTGSADSLMPDDTLVQVGHPGNFGFWVLAAGPFLRRDRENQFASEVPILVGNSGSPVLDLDGMVVGMSTSATIDDEQAEAWGEPFRDETVRHTPIRPEITTYHVPIDVALDRMEAWT